MIGVTIGCGPGWPQVARVSAERMSLMTGLDCRVITSWDENTVHPSWMKCLVLDYFKDEQEFMIWDADIMPMLPWNPAELFREHGGAFLACCDKNNEAVEDECLKFNIPFPNTYINAGLTIFSRKHEWIWKRAWQGHPKYGRWLEQTALNVALIEWERSGGKVVRIDRKYNTLFGHRSISEAIKGKVINAHMAGNGGDAGRLSIIHGDLKWV